jgi:hypothetical protein
MQRESVMNASDVFRVIGVRADNRRRVICRHATKSQAQRMKMSLDGSRIFPSVEIEAEANLLEGLAQSLDAGQSLQSLRRDAEYTFGASR